MFADKQSAIRFDENSPFLVDPGLIEYLADDTRHRRLCGTGVTPKHHVQRREVSTSTRLDEGNDLLNLLFD